MANKELRAAAGSAISKATPAVSRTARAIEDTQFQVTTGIMTGNAAPARNPPNDAISLRLGGPPDAPEPNPGPDPASRQQPRDSRNRDRGRER